VFKPAVLVQGHGRSGLKADQGRRWTLVVFAIKPMNVHAGLERLPSQTILILGQFEEIWKNERTIKSFLPDRAGGTGVRVNRHLEIIPGISFAVKPIRRRAAAS
jgi:hypothetical protein